MTTIAAHWNETLLLRNRKPVRRRIWKETTRIQRLKRRRRLAGRRGADLWVRPIVDLRRRRCTCRQTAANRVASNRRPVPFPSFALSYNYSMKWLFFQLTNEMTFYRESASIGFLLAEQRRNWLWRIRGGRYSDDKCRDGRNPPRRQTPKMISPFRVRRW